MRLYIIRHADPDYENQTLTAAGHQEANALARRLAGHGLDYIYTSPMPRAKPLPMGIIDSVCNFRA